MIKFKGISDKSLDMYDFSPFSEELSAFNIDDLTDVTDFSDSIDSTDVFNSELYTAVSDIKLFEAFTVKSKEFNSVKKANSFDIKQKNDLYLKFNSTSKNKNYSYSPQVNNNTNNPIELNSAPLTYSTPLAVSVGGNYISGGSLLSTTWNQRSDYDIKLNKIVDYQKYCPLDSKTGQRSVVGCVSTAASQILYYWAENGVDISFTLDASDKFVSYGSNGSVVNIEDDNVKLDFLSFNDFNEKMSVFDVTSADDIAALCYGVGVKVKMMYSSGASGAYSVHVKDLLLNDLNFMSASFADLNLIFNNPGSHQTATEGGIEVLASLVKSGVPLYITIPGHALVIDGFDEDSKKFHFNYGWGQTGVAQGYTGWHALDGLSGSNYITEIIIDAIPENMANLNETYVVTSLDNYGEGTLRRAIEMANNKKGKDTIVFQIDADDYSYSFDEDEAVAEIDLAIKSLTITEDLDIILVNQSDPDTSIVIDGNDAFRVFNIDDNTDALINVSITGGIITGGNNDYAGGGGIYTNENLTLIDTKISGNRSLTGQGGGIYINAGKTYLKNVTVTNNSSLSIGGVFIGNAHLYYDNDTVISGNYYIESNKDVDNSTVLIADSTAPSVPKNLAISFNWDEGYADLSWSASIDNENGVGVDKYKIRLYKYVDDGSGNKVLTFIQNFESQTNSLQITESMLSSLEQGDWGWTVSALDVYGNESVASDMDTVVIDFIAPDQVTNLTVAPGADYGAILNWSASNDNDIVSGYKIFAYLNGSTTPCKEILVPAVDGTSYTFDSLLDGDWDFKIVAVDRANNESIPSSEASLEINRPPDTEAPTAPTNLQAEIVDKTMALTFNKSIDESTIPGEEATGVVKYVITGTLNGSSVNFSCGQNVFYVEDLVDPDNPLLNLSFTQYGDYTLTVTAYDKKGLSVKSSDFSFKIEAATINNERIYSQNYTENVIVANSGSVIVGTETVASNEAYAINLLRDTAVKQSFKLAGGSVELYTDAEKATAVQFGSFADNNGTSGVVELSGGSILINSSSGSSVAKVAAIYGRSLNFTTAAENVSLEVNADNGFAYGISLSDNSGNTILTAQEFVSDITVINTGGSAYGIYLAGNGSINSTVIAAESRILVKGMSTASGITARNIGSAVDNQALVINGDIIVQSNTGDSTATGICTDGALNISVSGVIYAGSYVSESFIDEIKSGNTNNFDTLKAAANGQAIVGSTGDDKITLNSDAMVLGDIDFENGNDQLIIDNNAKVYGDLSSLGNLNVTFVIDDVTTGSALNVTDFSNIMSANLTIDISEASGRNVRGRNVLITGEDISLLKNLNFTIKDDSGQNITIKAYSDPADIISDSVYSARGIYNDVIYSLVVEDNGTEQQLVLNIKDVIATPEIVDQLVSKTTIDIDNVEIQWNDSDNNSSKKYLIQYGTDKNFVTKTEYQAEGNETNYKIHGAAGERYFVRIKSIGSNVESNWSDVKEIVFNPADNIGDSLKDAKVIDPTDFAVTEFIGLTDKLDYYKFEVSTQNNQLFQLDELAISGEKNGFSPKISLYRAKGNKLELISENISALPATILKNGVYYLKVECPDATNNSSSSYNLTVKSQIIINDDIAGEVFENAFLVNSELSTVTDSVGYIDPIDMYKFEVTKDKCFDMSVSSTDTADTFNFYLYQEFKKGRYVGYKLIESISDQSIATYNNLLLQKGNYYVKVVKNNAEVVDNNEYTFDINAQNDMSDNAVSSFYDAMKNPINITSSNSASERLYLGHGKGQGIFSFNVAAAGKYTLQASGLEESVKMNILKRYEVKGKYYYKVIKSVNSRFNRISQNWQDISSGVVLDSGEYFVQFVFNNKRYVDSKLTDVDFSATVQDFGENFVSSDFVSAQKLDISTTKTVLACNSKSVFEFAVENAGEYTFNLNNIASGKTSEVRIYSAYDYKGVTRYKLIHRVKTSNNGYGQALSDSVDLMDGNYYVQVITSKHSGGTNSNPAFEIGFEQTKEYDNSVAGNNFVAAKHLGIINSDTQVSFEQELDYGLNKKYYMFELSEASSVDFSIGNLENNAVAYIYQRTNVNGRDVFKRVKSYRSRNISGAISVDVNNLYLDNGNAGETAQYYIEVVSKTKNYNTDYNFELISNGQFVDTVGDTYTTAKVIDSMLNRTDISDNSVKTTTLAESVSFGDGYDVYRLDNDAAANFIFNFESDSNTARLYVYEEVINSNGRVSYRRKAYTCSKNNGSVYENNISAMLDKGTYYIQVVGRDKGKSNKYSTHYEVNISKDYCNLKTENNIFVDAQEIVLNNSGDVDVDANIIDKTTNLDGTSGYVGFGDAKDIYKIDVNTGGEFDLKLTGLDSSLKMNVYKEYDGFVQKRIKSYKFKAGDSLSTLDLNNGVYYIEIASYDNGRGRYNCEYNLSIDGPEQLDFSSLA